MFYLKEYLELLAAAADGKVVSYKDGRKVAEQTLQVVREIAMMIHITCMDSLPRYEHQFNEN